MDAPCLDCGEPVQVRMRDGEVLEVDPPEVVGYVAVPLYKWFENIAHA